MCQRLARRIQEATVGPKRRSGTENPQVTEWTMFEGATPEPMIREIIEAMETISSEKPLLLVFEDLPWADPSTVDFISALARRRSSSKLLLIGTYRPVDVALVRHPLKTVKQDLLVHQLCREIALEPLTEGVVAECLAIEAPEAAAPQGLASLIYRHSERNPLFMVSILDDLRDRGLIAVQNGTWQNQAAAREHPSGSAGEFTADDRTPDRETER
jgi:predicted ATPase